jgi:redox-sensitive bicupin YhaK (pirin superfamily)
VSNTDPAPEAINLKPGIVQAVDVVEARKAAIGDGAEVRRLLPQRTLRTIGAWCFLDHYGPDEVSRGPGMQVPPHPHIGLQTVSWLFQGPLAGYEVAVPGGDDFVLPVREDFEYGVVAVDGSAVVGGALIAPGLLAHLPAGLSEINLSPAGGRRLARFFVIGGVPFGEPLLMWWNFVARDGEEITRAREDWVAGRFPEVHGYPGSPLAAPPLPPVPLRPR